MTRVASVDVLAIGRAGVTITVACAEENLTGLGLVRGSTTVVTADRWGEIYTAAGPGAPVATGAAANTALGVAALGGSAAYAGRLGDDELGRAFGDDLRTAGIAFDAALPDVELPTNRTLVLETPGARTLVLALGAGDQVAPRDVPPVQCREAAVVFIEGLLVGSPGHGAVLGAAAAARRAGRLVGLTLDDASWVTRRHADFVGALAAVDILFADEAEAMALSGAADAESAVYALGQRCPIVTVTRGPAGALVAGTRCPPLHVPARLVSEVVDTSGAGDLYAAGFLFGLTRGLPLETCADLGCLAASEVITHRGVRPTSNPLYGLLGPRRFDGALPAPWPPTGSAHV